MPGIGSVLRWVAVFAGATAGSWAGRIAAARLYGEPVEPLMRLDARVLLNQDVAPGFLAAELLGKALRLGLAGEAVLAAGGAALSAIATGPVVNRDP
jgi:hypothetical protein